MEKADFDPSTAPVYELVQEVLRLRADISHIAAAVVQQAVEREWCGEYDQWARITNKLLSRPALILRDDWEEYAEGPALVGTAPVPTYDENPVYRDPATGRPIVNGCNCETCQQARNLASARAARDATLDESGRFNVDYLGRPVPWSANE
jgi:hypothetical protein